MGWLKKLFGTGDSTSQQAISTKSRENRAFEESRALVNRLELETRELAARTAAYLKAYLEGAPSSTVVQLEAQRLKVLRRIKRTLDAGASAEFLPDNLVEVLVMATKSDSTLDYWRIDQSPRIKLAIEILELIWGSNFESNLEIWIQRRQKEKDD
ncbi:MAG: hypothetical protein ACLQPD_19005 [Desulfomonilaceae bacterium]